MTSTKRNLVLAATLALTCGAGPSLAVGPTNTAPVAAKSVAVIATPMRSPPLARGSQQLRGHLRPQFTNARLVGVLAPATSLHLALGLPVRNAADLKALVQAVSDPRNPQYRHYLTPAQFAARFSPTPEQFAAVIAFAKANQLKVTNTFAHR